MKKYIYLLICIFIFTGCSVNYNIDINGYSINESIDIKEDVSKFDETIADSNIKNAYSELKNDKIIKYNNSKKKDGNFVTYNLSKSYSLSDSLYLRTFSECFDAYKFIYADDLKNSYILQTSEGFKCMDYEYQKIDSYKINIKTNHKVIDHNADEVNNNIYTWNIDGSNASTKSINFKFEEEFIEEKEENHENKINFKIIVIIISIFLLIIMLLFIYMISVNKKRNRF